MARMSRVTQKPSEEESPSIEEELPIVVDIRLRVSWSNLADFQGAWEQYKDRLTEYTYLEVSTMTIPPRPEAQVVQLD